MRINKKNYRTIWYNKKEDTVSIIDQTKLPFKLVITKLKKLEDVLKAINNMQIRGAPLIGATAAFGLYLAYKNNNSKNSIIMAANKIKNTRPTAINLFWAVERVINNIDLSYLLNF